MDDVTGSEVATFKTVCFFWKKFDVHYSFSFIKIWRVTPSEKYNLWIEFMSSFKIYAATYAIPSINLCKNETPHKLRL